MSALADFIMARVAEDEAIAIETRDSFNPLQWVGENGGRGMAGPVDGPSGYASVVVDPARVLRQCEAIRRVVERSTVMVGTERATTARRGIYDVVERRMALDDACEEVLAALAAIWSDHPDYRQEWRP